MQKKKNRSDGMYENIYAAEERQEKIILILAFLLLALFIAAIVVGIMYLSERKNAVYANATVEILEAENQAMENPPLNIDNDRLYIKDGLLGEVWLPVLSEVKKSGIDPDAFTENEKGYRYYMIAGNPASKIGIDVSEHQKDIDWKAVAASGIDFVMIRAGYRGYESGLLNADDNFRRNVKNAAAAGLDVGVYFYSQAVSVEEAAEEAKYVVDELDGLPITYPVAFDWENVGTDEARTDDVSAQMTTKCAVAFCEIIKSSGYTPMVYASRRVAYFKYDLSQLKDYRIWLAEFDDAPSLYYQYDIWQYTCEGKVDGIDGDVDLNVCFEDYSDSE